MLKIRDLINIIEEFAPLSLQESYDNCGIMCGDLNNLLKKCIISLDLTAKVIDEAVARGANLILIHHPIIFSPLKTLDFNTYEGGLLSKAIRNDLTVYAAHTNVDYTLGGLNDHLAKSIGLESIRFIKNDQRLGRIGRLRSPIPLKELADKTKTFLKDDYLRVVGDLNKLVTNVALINGGGGSVDSLTNAFSDGADIFMSADFKYHALRLAKELNYDIIEFGHYESEIGFIDLMADLFENNNMGEYVLKAESLERP